MQLRHLCLIVGVISQTHGCKSAQPQRSSLREIVDTPKDAVVTSKHASCRVKAKAISKRTGKETLTVENESPYLMTHAFDFEAATFEEREKIARDRLQRALTELKRFEITSAKPGNEDTKLGSAVTIDRCEIETKPGAEFECTEIDAPQVLVLNQALVNQFGKRELACGHAQEFIRSEIARVEFPMPEMLYCYLLVEKTRQHVDGEMTYYSDTDLNVFFSSSSSHQSNTTPGGWFRSAELTSESSSSASSETNFDQRAKLNFRVNTTYKASSHFVIERAFSTKGYADRNNFVTDAYQALLNLYKEGNTSHDVIHEVPYCVSQRIPIKGKKPQSAFITSMKYYPY